MWAGDLSRSLTHMTATASATAAPVLVRVATPDDADAIARLAALDSAPAPAGPLLLAEVAGDLRAAVRVEDRAAIADPFEPTAGLVALLRARAAQLA
jgi:hypothetical protein